LVGFLPWSAFLPAMARWCHQVVFRAEVPQPAPEARIAMRPLVMFGMVWAILIFLFFSFSQTKLLTYILPMIPAMALLTGAMLQTAMVRDPQFAWLDKWLARSAWALLAVAAIVGVVFMVSMGTLLPREARHISSLPANGIAVAVLLAGIGLMAFHLTRRQME